MSGTAIASACHLCGSVFTSAGCACGFAKVITLPAPALIGDRPRLNTRDIWSAEERGRCARICRRHADALDGAAKAAVLAVLADIEAA